MPAKRPPRSAPLEEALSALSGALQRAGVPWMVIGGVALIAHGVRRLTTDIDATVRGDAIDAASLLRGLAESGIVPRIPDAVRFATENLVLLLRHRPTGVDLDVSLAWSAFELEAIAGRATARFGRVRAPMARASDLLVYKAIAARPKDVEDALALLLLYPDLDLRPVRRRVAELASLAEDPGLLSLFDGTTARAAAATAPVANEPSGAVKRLRRPK